MMASADLDEDPTAEADPNALQVDSAGVPSILSGYTSPLFRDDDHPDSWQTRQPQRWEERHAQLHRKVQRLFDEIDDSGDGKLSAEEVAHKLVDDDELEEDEVRKPASLRVCMTRVQTMTSSRRF